MNNDDGKKPNKPYLKTNKIGGIAFEFTCTYDGEEREGIEIEEKSLFRVVLDLNPQLFGTKSGTLPQCL